MEIDKFKPKEPVEPKPYQRREWVSAVLTFFGFDLPLVYCGCLKAGILLEIGSVLVAYLLLAIYLIFPTSIVLVTLFTISIVITIGILIFNIRYTRKTNDLKIPRFIRAWLWIAVVFFGSWVIQEPISWLIKSYVCEAYKMPSTSMEKTILVGDYLLADKNIRSNDLDFGDLLIFKYPPDPSQNYIKRLIAKGGDKIRIKRKQVYLNGEKLNEPYIQYLDNRIMPYYEKHSKWGVQNRDNMPEIIVPEGKLFVLGDSRDNSSDSRFWGFVDEELLKGKAMFIHFSWDSEKYRVRWDRIGMRLDNISFKQRETND